MQKVTGSFCNERSHYGIECALKKCGVDGGAGAESPA